MDTVNCRVCGAGVLPETSFCRHCGAAISPGASAEFSEQDTTRFDMAHSAATQYLDPRSTRGDRAGMNPPSSKATEIAPERGRTGNRVFTLAVLLVILVIGILSTIAILRIQFRDSTVESADLVYPGARRILDLTNEDGGRSLHLESADSFSKVEAWYQANLKPQKTIRLTSNSVVMKNGNTTATIAVEGNKTNILIKQASK